MNIIIIMCRIAVGALYVGIEGSFNRVPLFICEYKIVPTELVIGFEWRDYFENQNQNTI
jgi:hypothetical protein